MASSLWSTHIYRTFKIRDKNRDCYEEKKVNIAPNAQLLLFYI